LFREVLAFKGFEIGRSALANLGLRSVDSYERTLEGRPFRVENDLSHSRLGYQSFEEILDLDVTLGRFDGVDEALAWLEGRIREGEPVILSGSTYYLPYFEDYRNPEFLATYPRPTFGVSDHLVVCYGLEAESALVFDALPHYFLGSLSMRDFRGFWRGNAKIPELSGVPGLEALASCGHGRIHMPVERIRHFDRDAFRAMTAHTIASEFLRGQTIDEGETRAFCGAAALSQLLTDIRALGAGPAGADPGVLSGCLQNMRRGRMMVRDLLGEGRGGFDGTAAMGAYAEGLRAWERASLLYGVMCARGQVEGSTCARVAELLEDALRVETQVFEGLLRATRDAGPLPRVDQGVAESGP